MWAITLPSVYIYRSWRSVGSVLLYCSPLSLLRQDLSLSLQHNTVSAMLLVGEHPQAPCLCIPCLEFTHQDISPASNFCLHVCLLVCVHACVHVHMCYDVCVFVCCGGEREGERYERVHGVRRQLLGISSPLLPYYVGPRD